ncbi:hypothetical protein [Streptomyces sp. NRRL F-2580]|uniref:hypothetical protein n=1 Tax=Streptomyces sp. NRRL F-2580 TaxID=1463841 RepID=UPI0004C4F23C|nr:hypothetical protein [Streptomyces sp. NRRL F-2580]
MTTFGSHGLLRFGVLFAALWWRSHATGGPRQVALAVLALTGPISAIISAVRASGVRAAVWFTGPGPAGRA